MLLDGIAFAVACAVSAPRAEIRPLLPYLPVYGLYGGYVMRIARLVAYVEEWLFRTSYGDRYVPPNVLRNAPRW